MSSGFFKIAGGTVYDPVHGVNGERRDIWIREGRIVDAPAPDVRPDRTLDAAGLVVMPGGVDMHCHIAGPKVNSARKMRPEDKRKAEKIVGTSGQIQIVGVTFDGVEITTADSTASQGRQTSLRGM